MLESLSSPKALKAVVVVQALVIAALLLVMAPMVAGAKASAEDAAYEVRQLSDGWGPGVKCR